MKKNFLLKILPIPMTFLSTFAIAETSVKNIDDVVSAAPNPYSKAEARAVGSLAIGGGTIVDGKRHDSTNSVAVGPKSIIEDSAMSTIAGPFSKITNSKSSAIVGGLGEIENSNFGVIIGNESAVHNAENGVIIGSESIVHNAKNGVAIGNSAEVANKNSVSIGSFSKTDRDNSISVGTNNLKRHITFVADGVEDSDAATVKQVHGSAETTLKSANNYTNRSSQETLSSANAYTDKSAEATLKSANNYTDSKISSYGNKLYQDLRQYTDQKADQLNNRINQVNKRIDKGLASSAALTGLFQPYGVGKVNFTAGIGGYRSTQALAIGSGYRVNENTAIKAGVALSDSKNIMYNASFNLEW